MLGAAGFYKEYEGYAHIDFVYQGEFDLDRDREFDTKFLRQDGDCYGAQCWGAFAKVRNLAGEEIWMIEANGLAREQMERVLPQRADVALEDGRCYVFLPERFALEKLPEEELKEIVRADEKIRNYWYTDIYGAYRKAAAEFVQVGLALLSTAALVVLLDVLLLRSIVRMEQEVNALEIALKKVMGSPFYVRYRGIVGTTLSAGALAVLAAGVASWRQAHRMDLLGAGAGVCLIVLELCFVALEAFRWERVQVQKILK